MSIQIVHGDLLKQTDVDAIVNTVNCVGVMGKGIALQFRNKWPENNRAYEQACKEQKVRTGKMFVFDSGGLVKPHFIINFPTKDHWRGKSKIEFIKTGLDDLICEVRKLRIRSIAIPPLGCGNGGLDWAEVRPLIESAFAELDSVEVRLFEPAGAPDPKNMEVRTKRPNMTRGRAVVLKLLETYRALNYGLSRIEVQKLTYFLQEAGEDLKLSFTKHEFGPYAETMRHVLQKMEGHFIRGVGDGVVESEIEPIPEALSEADSFIEENGNGVVSRRVDRITALIDGFQTPYGMELLATVHWVATHEGAATVSEAINAVHQWNERKRAIMQDSHIEAAWERLQSQGWLIQAAAPPGTAARMA
jgi:O-acetyl-ADP-ribose deacetylase (regulator of RNase III)